MEQATPKKLGGGRGWGVLVGPGAKVGDVVQVTTRKGKTWEATLTELVGPGLFATSTTEATPGATRERLERRLEQRESWAESRERKQAAALAAADLSEEKTGIPLGQPILVGHHSERRHRKVIERATAKGFESLEHAKMAGKHNAAAGTIARQLDRAIFDDDPDAVERLTERIADLEAQRERVKDLNRRIRKGECLDSLGLTDKETADLMEAARWHRRRDFPPYVLQNLGNSIRRYRQRLGVVSEARAREQEQGQDLAADCERCRSLDSIRAPEPRRIIDGSLSEGEQPHTCREHGQAHALA